MSTANEKPRRKRATRARRASRAQSTTSTYVAPAGAADATSTAREHYHREKARRAGRERPADHPLEQARRAYEELLAKEAEQAKGGRPRKIVTAAKAKRARRDVEASDSDA
jgi:hypothetical protein